MRGIGGAVVLSWLLVPTLLLAQERGPIQRFGEDGRLYSVDAVDEGTQEAYLVSKQTYQSEDSRGMEGDVRFLIKYAGGGYEIKLMHYVARCRAVDDMLHVVVHEAGEESSSEGFVEIRNPEKTPLPEKRAAYNLYWAACRGQFQKFE